MTIVVRETTDGIGPHRQARQRVQAIACLVVFLSGASAHAQDRGATRSPSPFGQGLRRTAATEVQQLELRSVVARHAAQPVPPGRSRSLKRKVLGAAAGAVGGFFAGGFLGAAIEGDRCNCDDPGFTGFVIGAPVGAVVGGVLGAKFLF